MAEEGMTPLQAWLSKPRATVRVDRTVPWAAWMKVLRRPFGGRDADSRPRIEVLDRLSLGGKKSLLLIAIEGRRLLVGVGEGAAPSISTFDEGSLSASGPRSRTSRRLRGRRMAR
jgi:flagellar biogenesis protein FliO